MKIDVRSNATVVQSPANRPIRIVSSDNPEVILVDYLKEYLEEVGYASMFPNFQNLRIGNVHPFALTLLQEVMGQKIQTDVFPSITVADSTDSSINQTLNLDMIDVKIDKLAWGDLMEARTAKKIHIADENVIRIEAVLDSQDVYGTKFTQYENHTFDFNIWGENKDVVSFLFDVVKQFLVSNINQFKEDGITMQGEITGRRSGDINVEFSKLLYGANISVQAMSKTTSLVIQLPVDFISVINVAIPE